MRGLNMGKLWARRSTLGMLLSLPLLVACVNWNPLMGEESSHPFAGEESWIAYQTDRTGEATWLVHPDGTDDHKLETGLPVSTLLPDWSPDGSKLAFASRGGETEPLYEYDMDSEETTQLFDCTGRCLGDDEPAYSPNGKQIAFVRYLGPLVDDAPSDCGLWVGDRDTGRVRQLTSNTEQCDREYYPRWSPDGKQLTYHKEIPTATGSVTTAVFVVDADGKREQRLTEPDMVAGEPDWSPDGEWIVFSTYPLNVFQDSGDSHLYRMHPDGTGVEQLTRLDDVRATQPKYRPDGDWIVFTAVASSQRSLWAIPAEGGEPVVLADQEQVYTHGVWQPSRAQ